MEEPSEWAAAMSKRAEMLSLVAENLSSRKQNSAQRAFAHHARRLEKVGFFLRQMEKKVKNRDEGLGIIKGHLLEEELSMEEKLLKGYSGRSALYVLMCSPKIMVELEDCSKRLNKGVEALSAGNAQLGHLLQSEMWELGRALNEALLHPNSEDEALLDSLEEAMLDTIVVDRALCVKLAKQIADGVGLEMGSDEFRLEIEQLRGEKSAAEARGGKVHALYLEQFLLVLDRALQSLKINEHTTAAEAEAAQAAQEQEKKMKKMTSMQSISGRDAPMLPLQSFICPIMRDVMRDPVQIASGQTYEREAIERWFAQGNTRCPVMGEELSSTHMKSNFALKQSIAEWRERNYEARLHGVARRLGEMMVQQRASGSHSQEELDQQAIRVVQEIRSVCEEEPLNKYKVGSMGIIPPMVELFHDSRDKSQVSKECLAAMAVLGRDNVENQEIMVKEGMIELLVRSLSRQKADLREAVVLMRLLSDNSNTAERISHAQGAVVFLVTLLGCEDENLNQDVKAILENVPSSDENVVIMAEANLVRPLASRIVEGSIESRIVMANALAGMHLPVSSKASLATEDVILSLLKMIEAPSSAAIVAALGALQNLTPVPSIAKTVLELDGFKQMEKKLSSVKTGEKIRVGAAKILADLSGIAGDSWADDEAARNELEVFIYKFLQLMGSFTPADVQGHVLKILLGLAIGAKAGDFTMEKLGEHKAVEILLPLLRNSNPGWVRKHAMELYHLLSQRFSRDACSAMAERPEIMPELLRGLPADPEKTLLLGIVASLEDGDDMLLQEQNLLDVVTKLVLESNQDAATVEAATGMVLKFSRLGIETQKKMAEAGLIERLVQLLEPGRSMTTRQRAAAALAEFSINSRNLTRRSQNSQKDQRSQSCSSGFVALCLPWLSRGNNPVDRRQCRVHHGDCTVRHSFCLVEADAVAPLVALLKDSLQNKIESEGTAAALAALATLAGMNPSDGADAELDGGNADGWNNGCQAIDKAKGVPSIIGAVSSSSSASQRLALGIVERMFCDKDYCAQYGASAQMHVIFAAQTGDAKCKRIAGRILRKLELVHSQSYFSTVPVN